MLAGLGVSHLQRAGCPLALPVKSHGQLSRGPRLGHWKLVRETAPSLTSSLSPLAMCPHYVFPGSSATGLLDSGTERPVRPAAQSILSGSLGWAVHLLDPPG